MRAANGVAVVIVEVHKHGNKWLEIIIIVYNRNIGAVVMIHMHASIKGSQEPI